MQGLSARLRCAVGGGVATGLVLLVWIGCSGPQSLSVAIDPQHEREYDSALRDKPKSPREAFYSIEARRSGRPVEEITRADEALSTTRNPFDAHRDAEAVSRGAVIFKHHCMTCHGETAEGQGPTMPVKLPKMNFHDFSHRFASTLHRGAPRAWFKKISEGYTSKIVNADGSKNVMPPFKDDLAREQIWLAITYLQSLDIHAPKREESSVE